MTKEKVCYLYGIYNKINGKLYVGITNNCKHRWSRHKRKANEKIRHAIHLAIAKYGLSNFEFKPMQTYASWEDACAGERSWIAMLKEFGQQLYNETDGGEGSFGVRRYGKDNPNFGKKMKPHVQTELLKHRTKLTDIQVEELKKKFATSNYTQTALAEEFKISLTQVHRIIHGRRRLGAANNKGLLTKPNLTKSDVAEIRQLYATGQFKQKELATKYNVSTTQISRIIRGLRWK